MKQLLLSLFFALVALTGLQAQTIWDGSTADTKWYDETSTEFEISTAEQLAGLAKLVNNGNDFSYKTVRLTADIVLNDTSDWENWESSAPENIWTPIGLVGLDGRIEFFGTFDGQGHTVSGIYINSENNYQGLFGSNYGIIKNVGVTESYIKGGYYVGGVCGENSGTISNCHNSGNVNSNNYIGGVCGHNDYYGTISNCYNSGNVSGTYYVGGVCGHNDYYGTISNCYNSGTVNGSDSYVGGVCGDNDGSISNCYNTATVSGGYDVGGVCGWNGETISNCYYLTNTATGGINGSDVSGQAEVKTAEQFASGEVCWLLNGSSDANPTWFQTINSDDSPVPDNTHGTVYAIGNCPGSIIYNNNSGSSHIGEHADNDNDGLCDFCGKIMPREPNQIEGFYQISNSAELYWFAGLVNGSLDGVEKNTAANAVLTADIIINENVLDADGSLTENADNLFVWSPIGLDYDVRFSGTFDGQGHSVSGIYINSENNYQGLFGYNSGTIKNVGITESYIKGDDNVGGVCGQNNGTISDCYNSGTVSGTGEYSRVGGVCGENNGTISNCYNSGTVTGETGNNIGGVCGWNNGGSIADCFNTGTVNGNTDYVGGVCGYNWDGTISDCYNSGTVSGNDDYVGSVCGQNHNGTISDCYYLTNTATGGINGSDVSGQAEVKTAEQFASGEVCWLLNGSSDANPTWFQTINSDDSPVPDNTHGTVYAIGNCPNDSDNTYSNQGPSQVGEHTDNDNDGRCDFCGKLMPREPNQIEGFYQISNRAELYWFAGLVNGTLSGVEQNTAANAVLTADIIINENVLDAEGNLTENTDNLLVWSPIGLDYDVRFSGTFDGQGHTVSGIYINSENNYQGLFGYNNRGTIKNVGVAGSYIKGDYHVGGVCGYNSFGTISNCYNTGTVNGNTDYVGGVCGENYNGTISNCYNSGNINGNENVGGVCGYNSGTIADCYNSGTVNGNSRVGGVCGDNYGTISDCYYLEGTAEGGIDGEDISNLSEAKTAEQFASGEVCWLLNGEQSDGAWGQKIGTDPYPVLGGPAVFKDGETYYNEKTTAIEETNNEQASFVIVSENMSINIYGSDGEATVYNLAGNIVYKGSERIIPVTTAGMYLVRIGNEVQKTIVR